MYMSTNSHNNLIEVVLCFFFLLWNYADLSGSSIVSFTTYFAGLSDLIFMGTNMKSLVLCLRLEQCIGFLSTAPGLFSRLFFRVDGLRLNGQFPPSPAETTSLFHPRRAGFLFSLCAIMPAQRKVPQINLPWWGWGQPDIHALLFYLDSYRETVRKSGHDCKRRQETQAEWKGGKKKRIDLRRRA